MERGREGMVEGERKGGREKLTERHNRDREGRKAGRETGGGGEGVDRGRRGLGGRIAGYAHGRTNGQTGRRKENNRR